MAQKFPIIWSIVLVFAIIWFGREIGWISYNFDFPWIPAILIIFAFGVIINRMGK